MRSDFGINYLTRFYAQKSNVLISKKISDFQKSLTFRKIFIFTNF